MPNGREDGEEILNDDGELLWRNAHPDFLDDGVPTSQLFRLTTKDEGKLSTARSAILSAQEHFEEYTTSFGLKSDGVWAVSVREVTDLNLLAIYDERAVNRPDPCPRGHTYIDLRGQSTNASRRLAGSLRDVALPRGRQYPD